MPRKKMKEDIIVIKTINKELREKLGDDLYNQVNEVLKDTDVVIETTENFILKERFNQVNEKAKKLDEYADYEDIKAERDELKGNLEKYADYEEIKEKASKIDGYADYDDIKTKYQEQSGQIKKLKLQSMGVDPDFLDYVVERVDGDDFDKSAKEFLETNPKFKSESFKNVNSSLNLGGGTPKRPEDFTNDEDYVAYRRTHNVDGSEKRN